MFRTQSGKVRCFVSASEPQRAGAPAAVCETYADETNGAFPQAPLITWAPGSSGRANIAGVNDRGELRWNHGDIPGANSPQDIVMQYGQTYQLNGWTIFASSAGTQLTNDRNRPTACSSASRTCHRSDREHSFPSPRKRAELMKKMTLTPENREITLRNVDHVHAILRARVITAEELIR